MSDSPTADRIESGIPPIPSSPRTFTVTVREMLRSTPKAGYVRLAQVDGLVLPEPLMVEAIGPCTEHADPQDPDANITVWSPKSWMFDFRLCPQAQGGREITVTFQEA